MTLKIGLNLLKKYSLNFDLPERKKKQIIIDRSVFSQVKPERQLKLTSKYIQLISEIFNKDKIYQKKLDSKLIENVIRKNFRQSRQTTQLPIEIFDNFRETRNIISVKMVNQKW